MADPLKIFISYNRHDEAWAKWTAARLEQAGYVTRYILEELGIPLCLSTNYLAG